jgi:hypothetical protein
MTIYAKTSGNTREVCHTPDGHLWARYRLRPAPKCASSLDLKPGGSGARRECLGASRTPDLGPSRVGMELAPFLCDVMRLNLASIRSHAATNPALLGALAKEAYIASTRNT